MMTGTLRQHHDQCDDRSGQHKRCERTAQIKTTMIERLVEKISNRCAEWASENERSPEQDDAIDRRPIICRRNDCEQQREYACCAYVSEAAGIGSPIT